MAIRAEGVNIGITGDTQAFEKSVKKGLIEPIESAADALSKLDKKGDLRATERGMEEARDATRKLESQLDDVTDKLNTAGRSGKRIGDDVKDGTGKASDSVREFGDEAKQNIGETFSSFRGDVSDFGQIAQDTLGGLASSMGGLPAIALTAAGAAGIGLILSALEQGAENSEEFRARVSELASELIETGKTGGASVEFLSDKLKELATTTEDGKVNLKGLRDAADDANAPFKDLAQAYAGNADGLDDLIRKTEDYYKALDEEQTGLDLSTDAGNRRNKVIAETLDGQERYLGYLNDSKAAIEQAAQAEADYAAAGGPELEVKASILEELASKYDSARDAAYEAAAADGSFDIEEFLNFVNEHKAAVAQYQTNLQSMKLTSDQWENFLALPEDARSAIAASYAGAGEDGKARIEEALTDAGSNAGAGAKVGFQESFGKPNAQVEVTVQTDQAKAQVEEFVGTDRKIEVKVDAPTDAARTRLDDLVRGERVAVVRTDVRTAAAYADLNNLVADRTATIRVKYVDNATGRAVNP